MCFVSDSLIKILSFATTMISDETHSLGLPDFPVDNVHAVVQILVICSFFYHNHFTTTVLRPFFREHPGEPVPAENFWNLQCKGRLTEADTLTIRLGATPSGLTSAHLRHPHVFIMVALCDRADHYIFALWFLLLFFLT